MLLTPLVSLVLALTVWRLPSVPLALAPVLGLFAAVAGLMLIRHAGRLNPVLNLALLRARGFTPAVSTVLLSNLAMYTLLLSLPLFLRLEYLGSAQVGLLLAGLVADDLPLPARRPTLRPCRAAHSGSRGSVPYITRSPPLFGHRFELVVAALPITTNPR